MNLSQIAAKPQLIKLTISDAELVAKYGNGEPLDFWTWDRQPIETFMKIANSQGADTGTMINIVRTLILDEQGNEILKDGQSIPGALMINAVGLIVELLGK
jgi:hypothetical protein